MQTDPEEFLRDHQAEAIDMSMELVQPFLKRLIGMSDDERKALLVKLMMALNYATAVLGSSYLSSDPEEFGRRCGDFIGSVGKQLKEAETLLGRDAMMEVGKQALEDPDNRFGKEFKDALRKHSTETSTRPRSLWDRVKR